MAGAMLLRERWQSGVAYNPLSARMAQDPYPVFAALRDRDPVHRSRLINAWLFTRYSDVDAILRDHRHFSSDPRKGTLSRRQRNLLPPADEFTMLFLDPPGPHAPACAGHQGLYPQPGKRPRAPHPQHSGVPADDIDDPSGFDLMEAVARPLPVIVIAEMLGVPPQDRARFVIWSAQRARLLEPTIGPRERRIGDAASRAFDAYFRSIIEQRRTEPRDDIVSALVQAEDDGGRLSEREMLNMLRLLLIAGHETTTNLIGNGVLALLRNPGELQRLREEPSLIPEAVEELLRFDTPSQMGIRRALADCEVNGFPLRRRDNIVLLFGAANRDPDAFENPDRLDIGRGARSHLSFGARHPPLPRCPAGAPRVPHRPRDAA